MYRPSNTTHHKKNKVLELKELDLENMKKNKTYLEKKHKKLN
jgi:hypothetical protein